MKVFFTKEDIINKIKKKKRTTEQKKQIPNNISSDELMYKIYEELNIQKITK